MRLQNYLLSSFSVAASTVAPSSDVSAETTRAPSNEGDREQADKEAQETGPAATPLPKANSIPLWRRRQHAKVVGLRSSLHPPNQIDYYKFCGSDSGL